MKLEKVKKIKVPLERLVYWINERESIRLKRKEGEPQPWTDDALLANYRFCNVRRMDDRVSQWLLKNWYEPYHHHENMPIAVALARFFNLPSSLTVIEEVLFDKPYNRYTAAEMKKLLRKHKKEGNNVFNGAYIVSGQGGGDDKIECVIDVYIGENIKRLKSLLNYATYREALEELKEGHGFAAFMSGQVMADLVHAVTIGWETPVYWAASGPGSRRGMHRVHSRTAVKSLSDSQFEKEFYTLVHTLEDKLPKSITKRLVGIDYQNCLCEFDKYERALWGEGRVKRKYVPQ